MLIDVSYFVTGRRSIQNASTSKTAGADSIAVRETIESYINELQLEFLKAMLGEKEGEYAQDYLEMEDETEDGEPSKYKIVCDRLKEPFADYVLYHILRDSQSRSTITGMVMLKNANTYVSPISVQVTTWNNMVKYNIEFLNWAKGGNCPIDIETETNMLNKINRFNL